MLNTKIIRSVNNNPTTATSTQKLINVNNSGLRLARIVMVYGLKDLEIVFTTFPVYFGVIMHQELY